MKKVNKNIKEAVANVLDNGGTRLDAGALLIANGSSAEDAELYLDSLDGNDEGEQNEDASEESSEDKEGFLADGEEKSSPETIIRNNKNSMSEEENTEETTEETEEETSAE